MKISKESIASKCEKKRLIAESKLRDYSMPQCSGENLVEDLRQARHTSRTDLELGINRELEDFGTPPTR
jgi:hypothetical protein